jgi:hypothetical protein
MTQMVLLKGVGEARPVVGLLRCQGCFPCRTKLRLLRSLMPTRAAASRWLVPFRLSCIYSLIGILLHDIPLWLMDECHAGLSTDTCPGR